MRNVKSLLVTAATSLVGTVAFAADMPIMPPEAAPAAEVTPQNPACVDSGGGQLSGGCGFSDAGGRWTSNEGWSLRGADWQRRDEDWQRHDEDWRRRWEEERRRHEGRRWTRREDEDWRRRRDEEWRRYDEDWRRRWEDERRQRESRRWTPQEDEDWRRRRDEEWRRHDEDWRRRWEDERRQRESRRWTPREDEDWRRRRDEEWRRHDEDWRRYEEDRRRRSEDWDRDRDRRNLPHYTGWFLRGHIGFSNQSISNIRKSDEAAYSQITSLKQTTGFDSAGTLEVGVGYQFNNWVRADVTAQYRGSANFHGSDVFSAMAYGGQYSGVDIYQARKTEWLFLTNVYFDLGTWWGVTPFLGAGIGTARVNISNFTDSGAVSPYIDGISCTATAPCPGVYPGFATAESGSKWNFAWATHAGLAYQINSSTTLELAYSYINLGSGTTGVISDFTGYNGGNVMKFKDITSHDLKFGVRWMLDAPTSWLTPPLSGG